MHYQSERNVSLLLDFNSLGIMFASLPEALNFVGRRAEIRLVIFWERCSVPAAHVIRAFRRLDLTRLPEEGDFLTLRVS
ncbi:hypothetical protein F2Q69_00014482 [Brassica cretica]|uniref:Uncharacterized protein n=1 Tax=Brassica cretica TaxID=69181 RepID=A0A8S9R678_BRACR|nr:hypothetical protein F2Q69_00014482 [Brassica cretica]